MRDVLYDVPVDEDARPGAEVMGRLRLRTLTRIEECKLIESLLLALSFARTSVDCLGGLCD